MGWYQSQFCKIKHVLIPIFSAVKRNNFKILNISYPCTFSIRCLSVRQCWLFAYRLFRSLWYIPLASSYLPFCHLSSPLEAIQVHGEQGKLEPILIAALVNAAVREEWAAIVWHLYRLWISIIHMIPASH